MQTNLKDTSKIFERIVELYTFYGYDTVNDFALNGLEYSASEKINRLKNPKNKPSVDIISDISNKFEVSADWLLFGEGEMLKRKVQKMLQSDTVTNTVTFSPETKNTENVTVSVGIPLIPIDAMAGFGSGDMQVMDYDTDRYIVPEFEDLHVDYMIKVKGDSMQPKYSSGDVVACRKLSLSDIFFQWNKVYVLDTEQGALIKRIGKGPSVDVIQIISDNLDYPPFSLPVSKIRAIAIVVGVIRLE